jgi:hypothetical protein
MVLSAPVFLTPPLAEPIHAMALSSSIPNSPPPTYSASQLPLQQSFSFDNGAINSLSSFGNASGVSSHYSNTVAPPQMHPVQPGSLHYSGQAPLVNTSNMIPHNSQAGNINAIPVSSVADTSRVLHGQHSHSAPPLHSVPSLNSYQNTQPVTQIPVNSHPAYAFTSLPLMGNAPSEHQGQTANTNTQAAFSTFPSANASASAVAFSSAPPNMFVYSIIKVNVCPHLCELVSIRLSFCFSIDLFCCFSTVLPCGFLGY